MGITKDGKLKRRKTGGKPAKYMKKRKFALGRPPANTKLGESRVHLIRCRGGFIKKRALRVDSGNYGWSSEGIARKTRILAVVYNPTNNEFVRTNTVVKGEIVQVDATPFKLWYETYYGVAIGKKVVVKKDAKKAAAKSVVKGAKAAKGAAKSAEKGAAAKDAKADSKPATKSAKPAASGDAKTSKPTSKEAKAGAKGPAKSIVKKTEKAVSKDAAKATAKGATKTTARVSDKRTSDKRTSEKRTSAKGAPAKAVAKGAKKATAAQELQVETDLKKNPVGPIPAKHTSAIPGAAKGTLTGTLIDQGKGQLVIDKHIRRAKRRVLEGLFEEQFASGRLLACVSSRPGQHGAADGYLLEGKELDFYLKKVKGRKGK